MKYGALHTPKQMTTTNKAVNLIDYTIISAQHSGSSRTQLCYLQLYTITKNDVNCGPLTPIWLAGRDEALWHCSNTHAAHRFAPDPY